jgi:hypothetical protein
MTPHRNRARGFARGALLLAAILLASAVTPGLPRAEEGGKLEAGDVVLPAGVSIQSLLIPQDAAAPAGGGFDVAFRELPVVAEGTRLVALGDGKSVVDVAPYKIDDFAFTADGRLILVSGDTLISPGKDGPVKVGALSSSGMKLRAAGKFAAYLFGGKDEPGNHDVYLLRPGGELVKLATLPSPIADVSGVVLEDTFQMDTFAATGRKIYRIESDAPVELIFEAGADIVSIAKAGADGIYYATKNGVGYVDINRRAHEFMPGHTGVLRLWGDNLYVWSPDERRLLRIDGVLTSERWFNAE